jgi:hypothetical protein
VGVSAKKNSGIEIKNQKDPGADVMITIFCDF